MTNNKLSREELRIIATRLRGQRAALAQKANVSIATVNNTFQDLYQNMKVIRAAKEMLEEQLTQVDPTIEGLRQIIADK
jgi:predicted  nucleic acid-binding Zn-ribbon protein